MEFVQNHLYELLGIIMPIQRYIAVDGDSPSQITMHSFGSGAVHQSLLNIVRMSVRLCSPISFTLQISVTEADMWRSVVYIYYPIATRITFLSLRLKTIQQLELQEHYITFF